jgi:hypothetical protein
MSIKKFELLKKVSECNFNVAEAMQVLKMERVWLMSWGARTFENYNNTALSFRVSGRHFKGNVIITLSFDDTYSVTLASTQWNEKERFTNVYVDQLSELLDCKIERTEIYKR